VEARVVQVVAVVDRLLVGDFFNCTLKEFIMKKTKVNSGALTLVLAAAVSMAGAIASLPAQAQDQIRDQTQDQTQLRTQDPIYGSQLMTPAERDAYRAQMRSLNTEEGRNTLRLQHHEQMKERARLKGVELPDQPPMQQRMSPAAGPGPGAGPGAGPRSGAGAGRGPGAGAGAGAMR